MFHACGSRLGGTDRTRTAPSDHSASAPREPNERDLGPGREGPQWRSDRRCRNEHEPRLHSVGISRDPHRSALHRTLASRLQIPSHSHHGGRSGRTGRGALDRHARGFAPLGRRKPSPSDDIPSSGGNLRAIFGKAVGPETDHLRVPTTGGWERGPSKREQGTIIALYRTR